MHVKLAMVQTTLQSTTKFFLIFSSINVLFYNYVPSRGDTLLRIAAILRV